jgi:UDPglucose 6-dehydrogenase
MKVAVVGTGYVGLVTGVVLAELGHDVTCVDRDKKKVDMINSGISPIYEVGLEELLKRMLIEQRFRVITSIADATKASDVVFIAVGTPPGEDGTPDLTAVKIVAQEIARNIEKPTIVVNKSTVPVGTGDLVEQFMIDAGVPANMVDIVSSPEFLREGTAVADAQKPYRLVFGAKRREAAIKLVELYAAQECPMYITDLRSAELIKYASNCFLAMKISYINALSHICEQCGANIADVAKGMGADERIGKAFLNAGLGWGGSCLPKDTMGLVSVAQEFGYDFRLLKSVIEVNEDQTDRFVDRIESRIGGFSGKTVGILGLAFKGNTDDIRDSKALVVIDRILRAGGSVRAYDPAAIENTKIEFPDLTYCHNGYEVADGADCVVIVTEWREFASLDLFKLGQTMKQRILFDGRRLIAADIAQRAGFEYHTIGQQTVVKLPVG